MCQYTRHEQTHPHVHVVESYIFIEKRNIAHFRVEFDFVRLCLYQVMVYMK